MNPEKRIEFLGEEPIPSSDEVWQGIQEQAKQGLIQIGIKTNKPFFEKQIGEMLHREEVFVKKIWDKITSVIESGQKNIVILFDIDQTIGEIHSLVVGDREQRCTIIRPSFNLLTERLRNLSIDLKIGLLSTRNIEDIQEQLKDPIHLQPIAQSVDNRYCFSTDQLPSYQKKLVNEQEGYQQAIALAKNANIVTDNIYDCFRRLPESATPEERHLRARVKLFPADIQKILLFRNLLNPHFQYSDGEDFASPHRFDPNLFNERSIIIVDDFMYPIYLNPDVIQGISLKSEIAENRGDFTFY